MAKHTTLSSLFTAIADAIRTKKGLDAGTKIVADNFPDEIAGIESGTDTTISSNAATASDIRCGKKAYVNGSLVTGTVTERTSSSLTVNGAKVSVPAGIYSSATSKSVSTATQATPSISVSSSGLITASATQSAGYVSSGTKSGTKQLSSSDDADFIPSNIKSGVSIFGVTGTFVGESSGTYGVVQGHVEPPAPQALYVTVSDTTLVGKYPFLVYIIASEPGDYDSNVGKLVSLFIEVDSDTGTVQSISRAVADLDGQIACYDGQTSYYSVELVGNTLCISTTSTNECNYFYGYYEIVALYQK